MATEAVQERRDVRILLLPLVVGLGVPWAAWALTGALAVWTLAGASLAMAAAYLICVHRLGDREAERRRRLGRRYEPPPPRLALAVCGGLAGSLLAPGLSVQALAATIGYPRLAGEVRDYDAAALARTGAEVTLSPAAMPLGARLLLLNDRTALLVVPRFGQPTVYAFPWHPAAAGVLCLGHWCFMLDPRSGRLRTAAPGGVEMGRVAEVGGIEQMRAERSGVPWEVRHLFADAALFGSGA